MSKIMSELSLSGEMVHSQWNPPDGVVRQAILSKCGKFRYRLYREWDVASPMVTFIGLNPSTADHLVDDPTTRRLMGFAKSWGCGSMEIVNLLPIIATRPQDIPKIPMDDSEVLGNIELHKHWLLSPRPMQGRVVACWGNNKPAPFVQRLKYLIFQEHHENLYCFGLTKGGEPKHPLYLRKDTALERIRPLWMRGD